MQQQRERERGRDTNRCPSWLCGRRDTSLYVRRVCFIGSIPAQHLRPLRKFKRVFSLSCVRSRDSVGETERGEARISRTSTREFSQLPSRHCMKRGIQHVHACARGSRVSHVTRAMPGGSCIVLQSCSSYAPAVKRCPCVYMKKSQDSSDGIKGNFVGIAPCTAPCHQYQLEAFVTFRCRRSIQAKNLHCDVRFPRDMPCAWMSLGTLYAA